MLAAWLPATADSRARHRAPREPQPFHYVPRPNPVLEWPFELPGSQYVPVNFSDIPGWGDDDQLPAFQAFRTSCRPISAARKADPNAADSKVLGTSLRDPCQAARQAEISDSTRARAFFEQHFKPLRIARLGESDGFVTGYYEPVIDGSRTRTDVYTVPVYRRPSNLFVRGYSQASPSLPNGGDVFRKIGRRKLVPYYDRAQIEDGAIAGRGLEIAWLKSETDLLFTQIQGSARIRLEDGGMVRINYDSHNGYRYTPVGRVLIDRGIIPREQMSMQKIRQWMEANPEGANDVRRQNRAYVFFREVQLSDKDEAVGAQGVPLTAGRSIAVDKGLHVYGTPFFIEGDLPVETETSKTPFRRLMVAQDTGSAIVGPARADLYFGAGAEAGRVAGRMRHPARFVMLVPNSLDPSARGRRMPLPDARPSAQIAKQFPQGPASEPAKSEPARPDAKPEPAKPEAAKPEAAKGEPAKADPAPPPAAAPLPAPKPSAAAAATTPAAIPLPEARPPAAPQLQPAPAAKEQARADARPRRVSYKRRVHRRAPAQPPTQFRFPWQ